MTVACSKNVPGDTVLKLVVSSDSKSINFTGGKVKLMVGDDPAHATTINLGTAEAPRYAEATFQYDIKTGSYVAQIENIKWSQIYDVTNNVTILKYVYVSAGAQEDWTKVDAEHPLPAAKQYVTITYDFADEFQVVGMKDTAKTAIQANYTAAGSFTGATVANVKWDDKIWAKYTDDSTTVAGKHVCTVEIMRHYKEGATEKDAPVLTYVVPAATDPSYFKVMVNDIVLPAMTAYDADNTITPTSDMKVRIEEGKDIWMAGDHVVVMKTTVDSKDKLIVIGTGAMDDYDTSTKSAPWKPVLEKGAVIDFPSDSDKVPKQYITRVGNYAFYGANTETTGTPTYEVNFGCQVDEIGKGAFQLTKGTAAATMAVSGLEKVPVIGDEAFKGSIITSANISNCTELGTSVFDGCTLLASVTLPSGIVAIPKNTFNGCSALATVSLPSTVRTIGDNAFTSCSALKSLDLSNVTTIGEKAFQSTGLTSANIPNCTSIGEFAFASCGSLTSFTLCDRLTDIPKSLFNGDNKIASIIIPESVRTIGDSALCAQHDVALGGESPLRA